MLPRTWTLLKDTTRILLEGVPAHLELVDIRSAIAGSAGVAGVHDLHVWSLSNDDVNLSVHVTLATGADSDTVRRGVAKILAERFAIEHVTIQTEGPGGTTRPPDHP